MHRILTLVLVICASGCFLDPSPTPAAPDSGRKADSADSAVGEYVRAHHLKSDGSVGELERDGAAGAGELDGGLGDADVDQVDADQADAALDDASAEPAVDAGTTTAENDAGDDAGQVPPDAGQCPADTSGTCVPWTCLKGAERDKNNCGACGQVCDGWCCL